MQPAVAYLTFDLEPDCLPYLEGHRGMDEGLPRVLDLLRDERVPATFFATGGVAQRNPSSIRAVVADGHELGCHGMTHGRFTAMPRSSAQWEIEAATAVLREHAPVTSFRAPYLSFRGSDLDLLVASGYTVDSSQARYKMWRERDRSAVVAGLARVPASVPPSLLRLPAAVFTKFLRRSTRPLVLFAHPWEFVDLRGERMPLDCRFNTGDVALYRLRELIHWLRDTGSIFGLMHECAPVAE